MRQYVVPTYVQLIEDFGKIVDAEGTEPLYLVDTCFFEPPWFTRLDTKPHADNRFKGTFFKLYNSIIWDSDIDESYRQNKEACCALIGEIEAYFNDYLKFLKDAVGECGVPARTTERVVGELKEMRRLHMAFRERAFSVMSNGDERDLVNRKRQMAKRQEEYVNNVVGKPSVLSAVENRGIIDVSELSEDPTYRAIEGALKDVYKNLVGGDCKGVDEELLSVGLYRASMGERVIILTMDWGFTQELVDALKKDCLGTVRQDVLSGKGLAIVGISGGHIKPSIDTSRPDIFYLGS